MIMATWFEITYEGDPTDADYARVAELAAQGYTSGQLLNEPDDYAIPGTYVREGHPGDINDPERYPEDGRDRPEDYWREARASAGELRFPEDDPAVQAERDRLMPQACSEFGGEGCGGEVPEDGAEPDHLPGCPLFGAWRYIARFTPEVWQGDQAIEVDPLGPQEWDTTPFTTAQFQDSPGSPPGQHRLNYLDWLDRCELTGGDTGLDGASGVLDNADMFKDDPAAPEWVRRHQGPFTIRVRREPRTTTTSTTEQEK